MLVKQPTSNRRRFLQQASVVAACVAAPSWAQPGKGGAASRSVTIAQFVDVSQAQQDVSKDFLIGSRAAWQDINLRGGIRGRRVEHLTFETDGTPVSARAALDSVKNNSGCVVMSGSAGDQLATEIVSLARQEGLNMAHVAPWLQNSVSEIDDNTFPIFSHDKSRLPMR